MLVQYDSVHLPDVPADDLGELKQGLRRPIQARTLVPEEIRVEAFNDRKQDIFPCEQDVVALPVEAIDALNGALGVVQPILHIARSDVFGNDPQLAIQKADSVINGNNPATYSIIPTR